MKKFEDQIKAILKSELSFDTKSRVKKNLMQDLENASFIEKISLKLNEVSFALPAKALLKEKLLLIVDKKPTFIDDLLSVITFSSKFAFGTLASFLVLMLLAQPYSQIKTAKASSTNRIQSFEGEILITRAGLRHTLQDELVLKPGDIIKTRQGANATIVFADNSLLRLNENTKIQLDSLTAEAVDLQVAVSLEQGKLWGNLTGLGRGGADFKFKTSNLDGEVITSAIFDLEAGDSYSRVVNFGNDMVLTVAASQENKSVALSKGDLLRVDTDKIDFDEVLSETDINWIKLNLQQDIDYNDELVQNLLQERREVAGTVPGSVWYPVEELGRSAKLAVTLDPVKKDQIKLEIANEKLMEAEVLLEDGKEADELLEEYQDVIEEVAASVDNLQEDSLEEADVLNQDLQAVVEGNTLVLENLKATHEVLPVIEVLEEAQKLVDEVQVEVFELEEVLENDLPLKLDVDALELAVSLDELDNNDGAKLLDEFVLVDEAYEAELEYQMLTEIESDDLLTELEAEGVTMQKVDLSEFDEDVELESDSQISDHGLELVEDAEAADDGAYHESALDGDVESEPLEQLLIEPMVRE